MASSHLNVRGTPYRIERQIGYGLHSLVFSGRDLRHGRQVAIKVVNFLHGSNDVKADTLSRRQTFWKEIRMLLYLQPLNPYIIRVFNYDYNNRYGVIVMERGETLRDTLVDYMIRGKKVPPELTRQFWSQMVAAIGYMHRNRIVHGDCKPENFIQVSPNGSVLKLIDMGISYRLPPNVTSHLRTAAGTPDYVSPEMVNSRVPGSGLSRIGYKSDVWALGVILFEMTYGFRPLQAFPNNEAKLIFLDRLKRDLKIPKHPNKNLSDVLRRCLRTNERKRASIEDILKHPYLTEELS